MTFRQHQSAFVYRSFVLTLLGDSPLPGNAIKNVMLFKSRFSFFSKLFNRKAQRSCTETVMRPVFVALSVLAKDTKQILKTF